jgi:hypothetical protein
MALTKVHQVSLLELEKRLIGETHAEVGETGVGLEECVPRDPDVLVLAVKDPVIPAVRSDIRRDDSGSCQWKHDPVAQDDPEQEFEGTVLDAAELVHLLLGQPLEFRVATDDGRERYVRDMAVVARVNAVAPRDRVGARHGHGLVQLGRGGRKRLVEASADKLEWGGEASETSVTRVGHAAALRAHGVRARECAGSHGGGPRDSVNRRCSRHVYWASILAHGKLVRESVVRLVEGNGLGAGERVVACGRTGVRAPRSLGRRGRKGGPCARHTVVGDNSAESAATRVERAQESRTGAQLVLARVAVDAPLLAIITGPRFTRGVDERVELVAVLLPGFAVIRRDRPTRGAGTRCHGCRHGCGHGSAIVPAHRIHKTDASTVDAFDHVLVDGALTLLLLGGSVGAPVRWRGS